jgi:hypothetical protein
MSSLKQIEANRRNGQQSRGPKTARGKAVSSQNATKHGLLAASAFVLALDDVNEYQAHRDAVIESLQPSDQVEQSLAERAADLLWRLRRATHFEQAAIGLAQERIPDDLAVERTRRGSQGGPLRDDVVRELDNARVQLELLRMLESEKGDSHVSGTDAAWLADFTIFERPDKPELTDDTLVGIVPDGKDWEEYDAWTVKTVQIAIRRLAAMLDLEFNVVLVDALQRQHTQVTQLADELRRVDTQLDRMRRERLLPDQPTLDRVMRYEAHLNRQLSQVLHELDLRQGHP